MKKLLNFMLVSSLILILIAGGFVYVAYKKSQTADTSLLLVNTTSQGTSVKAKEARADDKGINLIYYLSKEDRSLNEIVLEVFNTNNQTLGYIVFPNNTEIELSTSLYQKLNAISAKLPQYFKAEKLPELFDKKTWYSYGQLIVDELLGVDTSYYTVIYGEEATFEEHISSYLTSSMDESQIKEVIKQFYKEGKSSLSKKKKLTYAAYYEQINPSEVTFNEPTGTIHTDGFSVDEVTTGVLIHKLQTQGDE